MEYAESRVERHPGVREVRVSVGSGERSKERRGTAAVGLETSKARVKRSIVRPISKAPVA